MITYLTKPNNICFMEACKYEVVGGIRYVDNTQHECLGCHKLPIHLSRDIPENYIGYCENCINNILEFSQINSLLLDPAATVIWLHKTK